MKLVKMIVISVILALPTISYSVEFWSGKTKITLLYPTSNHFVFNVTYSNPLSGCENGTRYKIDITNQNYNALVSSLMAAFMAGKEISMNIDDIQGESCSPAVNRFRVYQ